MPILENTKNFIYYIWLMTQFGFGFFSFNLKLFRGYCLFPVFINRLAVF